ncbi:MAG: adhesin [Hyphomicrobium sp.]
MGLAGCAATPRYTSDAVAVAPRQTVAQVADVEDDGIPAQTPPAANIRQQQDDPREPYSRNYGGINPSANAKPLESGPQPGSGSAPVKPKIPDDLPPAFRQKLVTALVQGEDE